METFLYILLCFLSIIGLSAVIKWVTCKILKTAFPSSAVCVVLIDDDNYEMAIKGAYENLSWQSNVYMRVLAFDNGLSSENLKSAKLLLYDYNIPLCNKENICEKIKGKQNE